jgi:hypothetical protein
MTVLIFADYNGSPRLLFRPPIGLNVQRCLESSNAWMSAEGRWVSVEQLEVEA